MFVGNGYYVTYFGMHDNFHLRPNRNQHIAAHIFRYYFTGYVTFVESDK